MPEPLAEAATWAGELTVAPSGGELITTAIAELGAGGAGGLLEGVPEAELLPVALLPGDELPASVLPPELELDVVPELLVPVPALGAGLLALAIGVPAPEAFVFVEVSSDFV